MQSGKAMAQLLFPDTAQTVEDIVAAYPLRDLATGAMVTRLAPSPTGELHVGTLYAAFLSYRLAEQTGGVFYLRLEDTDRMREVQGAGDRITSELRQMGILYREGYMGGGGERGAYGPYTQRQRAPMYVAFAKRLIETGYAYPCFCTQAELAAQREAQSARGVATGYYGEWARHRSITEDAAADALALGKRFVIRLRAAAMPGGHVQHADLFKGMLSLPENAQDIVLLKSDGLPTYHFAHVVDDTLMHTTHVLRGDEWLSSVPIHLQLFEALGFAPPVYGHLAPIMKVDGASKRKFSKRRDADGHVSYYIARGVPPLAVREYYMRLICSSYEDWRVRCPALPLEAFVIDTSRLSVSGSVLDLPKLTNIAANVVAGMTAEAVLEHTLAWARQFDPTLYRALRDDPGYALRVLAIGRHGEKKRKDIACWADVRGMFGYFWDAFFEVNVMPKSAHPAAAALCLAYAEAYDPALTKDAWFAQFKRIAGAFGFTGDKRALAAAPASFAGSLSDAAGILRLALTGRENSPDLYEVMQIMGAERVRARLICAAASS